MQCEWENCGQYIPDNITAHINSHIEEQKIYACMWKDCKRYNEKQSNKYTLQAHVRKHTNERPYQCNKCAKQYTRSDALNKHIKNHTKVEKETEELLAQLSIMRLKKKVALIKLEVEIRRRMRHVQDVKIARNILHDNMFKKLNGQIIRKRTEAHENNAPWVKYLKK